MKKYQGKILAFLLSMMLIFSTVDISAASNSSSGSCPYRSTHNTYTKGGHVQFYYLALPDYSLGAMHVLYYWYCDYCGYTWGIVDDYIGTLLDVEPVII